jgi:hypothetical protein
MLAFTWLSRAALPARPIKAITGQFCVNYLTVITTLLEIQYIRRLIQTFLPENKIKSFKNSI